MARDTSKTRSPAVGAAGQEMQSGTRLFLVVENHDLRQRWRPMVPPKKRLPMSAELEAILHEMAKGGVR